MEKNKKLKFQDQKNSNSNKFNKNLFLIASSKGQIVVEYVLLLTFAVVLAFWLTTKIVSRNKDEPGFLIKKWVAVLTFIGQDSTDNIN